MEIPLSEKLSGRETLEYRIHPAFRLSFLAIAAVLFTASTLYGTLSLPGLAAGLLSLLGALYTEHWVFATGTKTVTCYTGILPFLKKREWEKAEVSSFTLSAFLKGKIDQTGTAAILEKTDSKITKQGFWPFSPELRIRITLLMELEDGSTVAIDDSGIRSRPRLSSLARRISALTGIPLKA